MVQQATFREFIYTVMLILGFSLTGFFVHRVPAAPKEVATTYMLEDPHPVPYVANPVVRISVPEHNVFAP
jgi:hypothetical protein